MAGPSASRVYEAASLETAVAAILRSSGMDADKAACVAGSLIEADMMGHTTHGIALLPGYMESIQRGEMTLSGEPRVVSQRGACHTWDGRLLPGAWLISRAIDTATAQVAEHGVVTVVIAQSHHTGALATYLSRLTERGLMGLLACSSPGARSVAPFGGTQAVLTPNPLAAGIPTQADPILLDISSTITTVNNARRLHRAGQRFPGPWALDGEGRASDDPDSVLRGGGTLLPIGGLDHGHKGYALALLVEALTQGLAGWGRADEPRGPGLAVYLQVIDPAAFGGTEAFARQNAWLAQACRASVPRDEARPVRVPGEHAMARKAEAASRGLAIPLVLAQAMEDWARRGGVALPPAASG